MGQIKNIKLHIVTDIKMLKLAVGSTNPVKINSAAKGIAKATSNSLDDIHCQGFPVKSTVPDQPIGLIQTRKGATDRALNAWRAYIDQRSLPPDYSVGLEGGIVVDEEDGTVMHCMACICIYNGEYCSTANSASFPLPYAISKLVKEGLELGDADDRVFNVVNSKQGDGTVGKLTKGVIDRTAYYEHAVVLAFARFHFPHLYEDEKRKVTNGSH